jgi:hypothetical protein
VSQSMCPHCGWIFPSRAAWENPEIPGKVPRHPECLDKLPGTPGECPGSLQHPRNPESDRRPLWRDGGVK